MEGLNEKLDFEAIYQDSLHFQEMARIGNVGNYIISVFSDESPVPHFHFINTKTGDQGCIKILVCEYFKHEKYKAELNSNERKELQTFLTSPTTEEIYREGTTNFKVICHEWNKNNPDKTIDINTTQPNYRDLK